MSVRILHGDCRDVLKTLPAQSVQCCVTSPPYFGLRDYGVAGQIGLEATPDEYVAQMVSVFREVRRVLRDDGTCWLNIGDSYNNNPSTSTMTRLEQGNGTGVSRIPSQDHVEARKATPNKATPLIHAGIKKKDLLGIPWMVAFALRDDGWYLRSDIIWHKPNPMPESVTDRPTSAHEHVFLLTKRDRYFYDAEAIAEVAMNTGGGTVATPDKAARAGITTNGTGATALRAKGAEYRNARNVWTIATQPFSGAHFATMPPELAERCILAGSKPGDTILDPFGGAGTTGLVADRLQRDAVLIELNPEYIDIQRRRVTNDAGLFAEIA